eukprot:5380223-Pyramimonas_sp.AAC.1
MALWSSRSFRRASRSSLAARRACTSLRLTSSCPTARAALRSWSLPSPARRAWRPWASASCSST